jgi:hypothetical protein
MRTTVFIIIFFIFTLIANSKFQSNYYFQNADNSTYLDLPDSLFAFKNITNTDFVRQIDWDGYTDSTRSKKIERIDSSTVVKLLCPNFIKTGEYSYYMTSFFFISKQHKIGDIQPIIILGSGTDYTELILLTLDKIGKPIDYYSLLKYDCAGTWSVGDSLVAICPIKGSSITSTKIKTYVKKIYYRPDNKTRTLTNYSRIDSITYKSTILPTGHFKTKRMDSITFHHIDQM